jgi:hypothetical protein
MVKTLFGFSCCSSSLSARCITFDLALQYNQFLKRILEADLKYHHHILRCVFYIAAVLTTAGPGFQLKIPLVQQINNFPALKVVTTPFIEKMWYLLPLRIIWLLFAQTTISIISNPKILTPTPAEPKN